MKWLRSGRRAWSQATEAALDGTISPDNVIAVVRSVVPANTDWIEGHTRLLSSGIVDSFSVAELALALSVAFEVDIPLEALGVDNADTPDQLAVLISKLR